MLTYYAIIYKGDDATSIPAEWHSKRTVYRTELQKSMSSWTVMAAWRVFIYIAVFIVILAVFSRL